MLTNLAHDLPPAPTMIRRTPHRHLRPDAHTRPVDKARAALAEMPPEQRIALATELLRGANDPNCALQLRNAAQAAQKTANDLSRAAFLERHAPMDG